MIPSWANQSIVRLRANIKNERGSDVPDWSSVTSIIISPVSVQPAASSINIDGRILGLNDSYDVYCNVDADVHAGDHILYDDDVFMVMQEPRSWQSPTGRVSHKQFTMTRWAG